MRILLKCPTRSRPEKLIKTLRTYVNLAKNRGEIGVAISCDTDDTSMTRSSVQDEIRSILSPLAWHRIFYSDNKTKIQACNANMNEIDYPWDIVVLVSDDMIPRIEGWDVIIRTHMNSYFPDTNGILWFNDGFQGEKLNTLCIYGRKMYETLGYIYEPSYKSLFCDTELTDRCRGDLAPFCKYVPYCIIRHEHPGTGFAQNMDPLYAKNQTYWNHDMYNYIRRKTYSYDWSILIPTIPGRESGLNRLTASIREKVARICPSIRYEFCIEFDNKETSVGSKRQKLLQAAKGKYLSFIDDDDEITDQYIEDLYATIQGEYPVMRLRGRIDPYTFTHSTGNTLTMPMARGEVFLRPPNHLNPMMSDVAKLVSFKDALRGEDLDWTMRMSKSGFLTHEYRSDESRIHYIYNIGVRKVDPVTLTNQQQTNYETMLRMVWTPNGAALPDTIQSQQPPSQGPRILRLGPKGFVSK
jgi:glycosyltransferase involved in cell wall biosynthesis